MGWIRCCAGIAAALPVLAAAEPTRPAPGSDTEPTRLPPPGSEAWSPLHFRSISQHTVYTPLDDAEGVRAEADCAASALVLTLEDVDVARTPLLRWRWRVDRALENEQERRRDHDDFAARVYVMFRFEPEETSLLEQARRSLGAALFGTEMPGTALVFVWASQAPQGSAWKSPYDPNAQLLAQASGPADGWRRESVDVRGLYRAAFGEDPPPALALGIMTDADDTCRSAAASYADFRFAAPGS